MSSVEVAQRFFEEFPAYSEYKDSGIDWLGEIPKHWTSKKLKFMACINNGKDYKSFEVEDSGYPVIGSGGQFAYSSEYIFMGESVLFGRKGTIDKPLYVNEAFWTVDTMFYSQINSNTYPKFFYYCALTLPFNYYSTNTAVPSMTQEALDNHFFAFPTLQEQKQIATFLDRTTTEIDQIIEQQKQLITLLEEERTTIISHTVTKGLDPSVPMKDSGIEWLGEIPKHWELKKIKHVVHEIIDTEHKTAPFEPEGEYLVVRTSNVRDGKLVFDDAKYTDIEGFKEWTRRGVPNAGDILFTREAPAGEACIVPEDIDLCLGQRMVLFRVNPDLLDSNYCVRSIYGGIAAEFIHLLSSGSTVVHFNMADIKNIPIFIPPVKEQKAIALFLDQETARIDEAIDNVRSQIEKLEEYRTVLISDAVTGKIDVRGFNKE